MSRKSSGRLSLLDRTRKSNFLSKSFGSSPENDAFTKEEYVKMIFQENCEWKQLLKMKKKQSSEKLKDIIVYEEDVVPFLKKEDLGFYNLRLNYPEMVNTAQVYTQLLSYFFKLRNEYEFHSDLISEKINVGRDQILSDLVKEKPCSICDNSFCTESIHGLAEKAGDDFTDIISYINSE